MSIIVRILVIMVCAYAGSALAGMQFPEVPDPFQIAIDQWRSAPAGEIAGDDDPQSCAPFEKRQISLYAFVRPAHQEGMTLAGKPLQLRGRDKRMEGRRHRAIDKRTAIRREDQHQDSDLAEFRLSDDRVHA